MLHIVAIKAIMTANFKISGEENPSALPHPPPVWNPEVCLCVSVGFWKLNSLKPTNGRVDPSSSLTVPPHSTPLSTFLPTPSPLAVQRFPLMKLECLPLSLPSLGLNPHGSTALQGTHVYTTSVARICLQKLQVIAVHVHTPIQDSCTFTYSIWCLDYNFAD